MTGGAWTVMVTLVDSRLRCRNGSRGDWWCNNGLDDRFRRSYEDFLEGFLNDDLFDLPLHCLNHDFWNLLNDLLDLDLRNGNNLFDGLQLRNFHDLLDDLHLWHWP